MGRVTEVAAMIRHVLIDADVLVYKAACACEKAWEWEPGQWTYQADEFEAREALDREIEHIMLGLKADKFTLALTDKVYFRKAILPTYKGNRKAVKQPLVREPLRQWLLTERNARMQPGLEGDDVLGIMATNSQAKTEERIIVSEDKDMKTLPGRYAKADLKVVEVSEDDANWWHLFQTLTGDITDGYTGCPGTGAVKATKILNTFGPCWEAVVATYQKAKLTAQDALVQARVARILRASDYDFKRKEPILWKPTT
jgi:DNA polymerase I